MNSKPKLFLVDAFAMIFRAYYAFISRPVINSKGFNTSAILGFFNTLAEILRKEKPDFIAVAFDSPSPTFRSLLYPEYKAKRDATPEAISLSVPYIKKLITALNIRIVEKEGIEADDVIGTLARAAERKGWQTYMLTMDKDMMQLVSDNIFMYKPPSKGGIEPEILGKKEVSDKFGITDPSGVIDILALWGDTSDNIPGVPGVGEKTSKELISRFNNIDNLLLHLDELKGSVKDKISENLEQISISRKLATIITDADLEIDLEDLKIRNANEELVRSLCKELEFRTLPERLLTTKTEPPRNMVQGNLFSGFEGITENEDNEKRTDQFLLPDRDYIVVNQFVEAKRIIDELSHFEEIGICVAGYGVTGNYTIKGIAVSGKKNQAFFFPFENNKSNGNDNMLSELTTSLLENTKIGKTGFNIKPLLQILHKNNLTIRGELFDVQIAHYLLQPENSHRLSFLAQTWLGTRNTWPEIKTPLDEKDNLNTLNIFESACENADFSLQLSPVFRKGISENNLSSLAINVEMPLVSVLANMELEGFRLSTENLMSYSLVLKNEIANVQNEIYQLTGEEFNISSPKQLGEILFDKLKITDGAKRTKTKQYQTGEEVLSKIADKHPVINKILDYRALVKLLNTYVDTLPLLIDRNTGKIHTSFDQASVATGRLSSKNPNLQNIPIRDERGREIRKAFVPSKGNILVSADYSQIELRLMAHLSNDKNMIEAFARNADIHTATASAIFNVPEELVTREMRSRAKTANFGIIYGISAFGLSQRLNIPRKEAAAFIEGYFQTYPAVREYMDNSIEIARKKGYVETIMGRRRYLNDINSANAVVRGFAERNAINAPLQGSAADIIKYAMVKIYRLLEGRFKSKMILQVHDELIFDVLPSEKDDLVRIVRNEMENVVDLKVPLIVDIGSGNNWLEAH